MASLCASKRDCWSCRGLIASDGDESERFQRMRHLMEDRGRRRGSLKDIMGMVIDLVGDGGVVPKLLARMFGA
jgi:hypothetical protein